MKRNYFKILLFVGFLAIYSPLMAQQFEPKWVVMESGKVLFCPLKPMRADQCFIMPEDAWQDATEKRQANDKKQTI